MKRLILVLTAVLLCACAVPADDDPHHHEDVTPEQLGTVHFPTSCVIQVQGQFERGVALLHSFWYEEAEKQFNQIVQEDPRCAMANWGVAMSLWHELWNHPDRKTIKKGLAEVKKAEKLHSTNDVERGYISAIDAFYGGSRRRDYHDRAVAYTKAMETNYQRHPEDREGAAFYALALLASAPDRDTTFANQKKAGAILQTLFAEEPNHPGIAHYMIHSYDSPQLAELGLPAARAYAKIAPAAPHALHMPSHIFARLGLWQDDIDSNLASIAATRKTAAMHMGGESHQFHAMDFLEYAYLQSGREADAQRLIEEVKAMPEMKDNMYGSDFDPRTYALVVFTARYALELHHWSDAAQLPLVPGANITDNAITYWARAIGAARSGNPVEARASIAEIVSIHQALVKQKKPGFADYVDTDRKEAEAWLAYADGHHDQALKTLRTVAEKQEAEGDEPLAIPAREMLADMLTDMNQPTEALAEYENDLKFNPNRFDGLYGAAHAAQLAGKNTEANTYYAQLLKVCNGAASDRPELSKAKALVAKNN
jgi:tetratricopeptide (TPR) repeat protein